MINSQGRFFIEYQITRSKKVIQVISQMALLCSEIFLEALAGRFDCAENIFTTRLEYSTHIP